MKMRKILSLMGAGCLVLGLATGCNMKKTFEEPMDIATLNGPTGMGMTQVMNEQNENYNINLYQSADEITGKIISGDLEVACVPSNLASVLYTKTEKNIELLAVNTLGVLYIVENGESIQSVEDLVGQTILASGQGSTPEYVLNQILSSAGLVVGENVEVRYLANHTEVINALLAGEGSIALLPEPHVTIAKAKEEQLRVALDLNEAWEAQEGVQLPMGVIIARKDYVEAHPEEVKTFLNDYKKSVEFVNSDVEAAANMMVEVGLFEKVELAKAAIPNSHIVFIEGKTAKSDLEQFYTILKGVNPKAIGGNLPDEDFYYGE